MKGLGQHVQVGRPAMDISFYRTVGSPLLPPSPVTIQTNVFCEYRHRGMYNAGYFIKSVGRKFWTPERVDIRSSLQIMFFKQC